MMLEAVTSRGMYLGRSDSLEDTTHVLPRGMQFEVASVDYATYETAADSYGARIVVQPRERHGTVIFAGPTWSFVTGAARSFARRHCIENTLAPFVFRRRGLWTLWDGTVTDESRLETEDATVLAEQYLHQLFPQARIEIVDLDAALAQDQGPGRATSHRRSGRK